MHAALETLLLLVLIWYNYLEAFIKLFIPKKAKNVAGQVVLVTGAGSGIGRALAIKCARLGTKVALWDINKEGNEATAQAIRELGGTAQTYVCDITNTDAVKDAANKVRRDLGDVNILFNNAGIMIVKDILSLEEREIRKTIDINTTALFWTVREFLPAMMESNSGHIITVASMAGRVGTPLLTDYCASKFGAAGFAEALSEEVNVRFGKTGIHFSTVFPMFVNTNLLGNVQDRVNWTLDRGGKMLEAEEVADTVVTGMLKNQNHIYVPPKFGTAVLLGQLMPRKTRRMLNAFSGAGFHPKTEK